MIEVRSVLKVVKGDKEYQLICMPNSPLNEVFDVLVEMQSHIFQVIKKSEIQQVPPEDAKKALNE